MAREEIDREDLLRDGTAMVVRAECTYPGSDRLVTIGFRRNGAASFYFDPNWVWQFDTLGRVRRGFDHGRLIRAERGQLVVLTRQRSPDAVTLCRIQEDDADASRRLQKLSCEMQRLVEAVQQCTLQVVRAVPRESTFREWLGKWLVELAFPLQAASSPRASGNGSATTCADCREK